MRFNKTTRTFEGKLKNIRKGKMLKLATVKVDCGDLGMATFRVVVFLSKLGNPMIGVKTKKPLTGQFKKKTLMAVPIALHLPIPEPQS